MASEDSSNSPGLVEGAMVRFATLLSGNVILGFSWSKTFGPSIKKLFFEIASKIMTTPKDARFPRTFKQEPVKSFKLILPKSRNEDEAPESVRDRINRCFHPCCSTIGEDFVKNHRDFINKHRIN